MKRSFPGSVVAAAVLGLEGSGKTTLVKQLRCGSCLTQQQPTQYHPYQHANLGPPEVGHQLMPYMPSSSSYGVGPPAIIMHTNNLDSPEPSHQLMHVFFVPFSPLSQHIDTAIILSLLARAIVPPPKLAHHPDKPSTPQPISPQREGSSLRPRYHCLFLSITLFCRCSLPAM